MGVFPKMAAARDERAFFSVMLAKLLEDWEAEGAGDVEGVGVCECVWRGRGGVGGGEGEGVQVPGE